VVPATARSRSAQTTPSCRLSAARRDPRMASPRVLADLWSYFRRTGTARPYSASEDQIRRFISSNPQPHAHEPVAIESAGNVQPRPLCAPSSAGEARRLLGVLAVHICTGVTGLPAAADDLEL